MIDNNIRKKNDQVEIYFLGQSGYILKYKKYSIGIDLYLSNAVERIYGFKRLTPIIEDPDKLNLDVVISTHHHEDHFDVDSMDKLVKNKTLFIGAKDCLKHIMKTNIQVEKCLFVKPGDVVEKKMFSLRAVKCDHGDSAPDAVGIVLQFGNRNFYFTGDTSLRLDYAKEISKYGPFNVMFFPINGAFGNMNYVDGVDLMEYHKPILGLPSHFWTFIEHNGEPLKFRKEFNDRNIENSNVIFLRLGEKIYV